MAEGVQRLKRLLRYRYTVGWSRCTFADVCTKPGEPAERHHGVGLLVNWRSLWVGAHYSEHHRRWCINPLPCITIWWTKPGGYLP